MIESNYIIACFSAFLIGMSKSGIKGIGVLFVAIIAIVYGAKNSTGIIMPLLVFGDIFAVIYHSPVALFRFSSEPYRVVLCSVLRAHPCLDHG